MDKAIEKTIEQYNRAISQLVDDEPIKNITHRWTFYGETDHCNFCKACNKICKNCPLGPKDYGCANKTFDDLSSILSKSRSFLVDRDKLIASFENRLAWIKTKVDTYHDN